MTNGRQPVSETGASAVNILDHRPKLAAFFETLNIEWLEKYFAVEPLDRKILTQPERLIENGGAIVYAEVEQRIVGCCALKHHGHGSYELTKMAVTSGYRGLGIGRKLGEATIRRFQRAGGRRLYLESHHSLAPALHLYESLGFRHEPPPSPSPYRRSDVYMVWYPPD